jgi:hypothetical protein
MEIVVLYQGIGRNNIVVAAEHSHDVSVAPRVYE